MFNIYLIFAIINIFLCTFLLYRKTKTKGYNMFTDLDHTHIWTCILLIVASVIGTIIIVIGYAIIFLIGKKSDKAL